MLINFFLNNLKYIWKKQIYMSKNYFSAYNIFNSLLILIYPVLRNSGNRYMLKRKDSWGYQREDSIITILVAIILLRYIKYF